MHATSHEKAKSILFKNNNNTIKDSLYTIAGKSISGYKQQANGHSSESKTGPYSSPGLFWGFESRYLGDFICFSSAKCVQISSLYVAFHKKKSSKK